MVAPIEEIIEDMKQGKMVILVDEENRENEGDLLLASQFVTAEHINFMARYGRGLICLTLTEQKCQELALPLMVNNNQNRSQFGTNFTLSIEAAEGVTTGISAADRARTVQAAVHPNAKPSDIAQPGHIFPVMARNGGVLVRAGHTEAGCDLAALAGLIPSAVICEILKEDGEMARLPDLEIFAKEHNIKIGTIASLIQYRSRNECLIQKRAARSIKTIHGEFDLISYMDNVSKEVHLVLVKGPISPQKECLVRVHEPLSVMDFIEDNKVTHSWSIHDAMAQIARSEQGVMILLSQPYNQENLLERIETGTVRYGASSRAGLREYGLGAQILQDLNVKKMRLLSKPYKLPSLEGFDLEVVGYLTREEAEL